VVTAAQAQALIEEPKVIAMNLAWRSDGQAYRLEATVSAEESGEILRLRGFVGRRNRSFVLLLQNYPIRKYTVHAFHRDPVTQERVTQPHKHFWDDVWEDQRIYIPDDIRMGNANEELIDFLRECNISLRQAYRPQTFF
jgi:hypothetical protein